LVTRSLTPKCMTRVPTQITCQIFKQHDASHEDGRDLPFHKGQGGGRKYSGRPPSVNPSKPLFSEAGMRCCTATMPRLEGAQYSRQLGSVNDLTTADFWLDWTPEKQGPETR